LIVEVQEIHQLVWLNCLLKKSDLVKELVDQLVRQREGEGEERELEEEDHGLEEENRSVEESRSVEEDRSEGVIMGQKRVEGGMAFRQV